MMMSVSKASEPSPSRRLSEPPEIRRKGEKPANMDQGLNPENLFAFVWFPLYPQIPQFTGFFVSDLCLSAGVWNPCNQQLKSLPPPLPEPERFVPATQYPLVTIISIRGSAGSQAQTSRKRRKDSPGSPHHWRVHPLRKKIWEGALHPWCSSYSLSGGRPWARLNFIWWI